MGIEVVTDNEEDVFLLLRVLLFSGCVLFSFFAPGGIRALLPSKGLSFDKEVPPGVELFTWFCKG